MQPAAVPEEQLGLILIWKSQVREVELGANGIRGRSLAPRPNSMNWGVFWLVLKAAASLAAASLHHANEMLWFFSGNERMRLPVAAKYALSTAGAATQIVGSPTPPQKPPDGMTIVSTLGISAMRIMS
jgi:hypothetical protein